MKAIVLAAGRGTRLAPLTDERPKALVQIAGMPLLERQLRYLARNGVTDVCVNAYHHADQIASFVDERRVNIDVCVSRENALLGTAGALLPMADFLDENPVVLLYGDVVTDLDLGRLVSFHLARGGIASLCCYASMETADKGLVQVDAAGRVVAFVERPQSDLGGAYVNAGLYALHPSIRKYISQGADFGIDVWPAVLASDKHVYALLVDDYILDVGSPDSLRRIEDDIRRGLVQW